MAQKFRFTRSWEDLGERWKPGDVIYLSDTAYQETLDRMKRYSDADLCKYGFWFIPLSHLIKEL